MLRHEENRHPDQVNNNASEVPASNIPSFQDTDSHSTSTHLTESTGTQFTDNDHNINNDVFKDNVQTGLQNNIAPRDDKKRMLSSQEHEEMECETSVNKINSGKSGHFKSCLYLTSKHVLLRSRVGHAKKYIQV